jgi:hypothetical protein
MQTKLFRGGLADLPALEADINHWLTANPKLISIERDVSVYHDHATGEEQALIVMWCEPKSSF